MASSPIPPPAPRFTAWIEQERAWGSLAVEAIARLRRKLAVEQHGLDRFAARMSLVELTGSVASWASGLGAALGRAGHTEEAAQFDVSPPFAADASSADCDRLRDYVQARVDLLAQLLSRGRA